jgi:hypothetical protein
VAGAGTYNVTCGDYGAYSGEIGGFYDVACPSVDGVSDIKASAAVHATENFGIGANSGFMPYFFLGGPGLDPSFNATTSEAAAWGKEQSENAVLDVENYEDTNAWAGAGEIFGDIESPNSDGWNNIAPNCGTQTGTGIAASVDMALLSGFDTGVLDEDSATGGNWEPAVYVGEANYVSIFGS